MRPDENKKRHIVVCGKGGGGQAESVEWDDILNKPEFATVATTGDYDDLTDKPTIPAAQVNADWNAVSGVAEILNKPTILTQWFGTQAEYDLIDPKDPNTIYNIEGSDNVQADWNQSDTTADDYIKNKPTIPAAQVNSDWNAVSGVAQILNKPTIPAAQVNSDWNAVSGVAEILNKPAIPANTSDLTNNSGFITISDVPAQEQADWNQTNTTAVDFIKNKPTIPTVPAMATQELTFTLQGGTTKTIDFYVVPNYFYVEDISGSSNTLTITKVGSAPVFEVFTSTDRTNWTSMGTTSATITTTIPANSKLYLKATTNQWGSGEWNYANIKASGNHNVGGNSMSLLYGDNFAGKVTFPNNSSYALIKLFNGDNKLVNANKLELPATTLASSCYLSMFEGCTALTTAPAVLPATSVPVVAYYHMFYGCSSLTTAPDILATAVSGNNACQAMFYGCTALTTAPTLLIKELKTYNNLCKEMFRGCTSLNNITVYFNDVSGYDCLSYWVTGVAATGDFYNLGTASLPSGQHGIPSGWTVHTSL